LQTIHLIETLEKVKEEKLFQDDKIKNNLQKIAKIIHNRNEDKIRSAFSSIENRINQVE